MKLGKWEWVALFILGFIVGNIIGLAIVGLAYGITHKKKPDRKRKPS